MIEVVVGAQYGSEAKGHVTRRLVDRAGEHWPVTNVRVAGPNAGHTAYDVGGRKWALRQVPVGATSDKPVELVIAAGSEIDPEVLLDEIDQLTDAGLMVGKALYVHKSATLIEPRHKDVEAIDRLVTRIGSTGKGIGAARADRIMRTAHIVGDNVKFQNQLLERGVGLFGAESPLYPTSHIIVEGTQGYGLGLHTNHYPYTTSSDCRAIDFLAMAGISPWRHRVKVWAVARMFPIRVAGNSGPMKNETSWEELGLPEEKTTVTQKVRRVGGWDIDLVREAVAANGGKPYVRLALTMADQKWSDLAGSEAEPHWGHEFWDFQRFVEEDAAVDIEMVTTGVTTGFDLC